MKDGLQALLVSAALTAAWAFGLWFADRTGGSR